MNETINTVDYLFIISFIGVLWYFSSSFKVKIWQKFCRNKNIGISGFIRAVFLYPIFKYDKKYFSKFPENEIIEIDKIMKKGKSNFIAYTIISFFILALVFQLLSSTLDM